MQVRGEEIRYGSTGIVENTSELGVSECMYM